MVFERAKPLMPSDEMAAGRLGSSPHFEGVPGAMASRVDITHTQFPPAFLIGADPGLFRQKLSALTKRPPANGTIMLATVFLPPITHSPTAVARFYEFFGASEETLDLVKARADLERDNWFRHIRQHRRIDVVDMGQVEEYLASPEYFQLPLTSEELVDQVERLVELLSEPNYELRLTRDAIDIPFELAPGEVRIRSDRRNKGQPRQGRIATISFHAQTTIDVFETEFWQLYRASEPSLDTPEALASWFRARAESYTGRPPVLTPDTRDYDVFLCYNSEDASEVAALARRLEKAGLRPWLDTWDAQPGRPAIMTLESAIDNIACAAVFVGQSGLGPWQTMESHALIARFLKRQCPVIPVLLRSAPAGSTPELPAFLGTFSWVNLRDKDGFKRLEFGIDPSRTLRR